MRRLGIGLKDIPVSRAGNALSGAQSPPRCVRLPISSAILVRLIGPIRTTPGAFTSTGASQPGAPLGHYQRATARTFVLLIAAVLLTLSATVAIATFGTLPVGAQLVTTWTPQNAPSGTSVVYRVACPTTNVCFAAGWNGPNTNRSGAIVSTPNGGSTWTDDSLPSGAGYFNDIACPSTNDCFAVGVNNVDGGTGDSPLSAGVIFGTVNGGSTWTSLAIPVVRSLAGIACTSTVDCYAVGLTGSVATVLATTNGGSTWSNQGVPSSLPWGAELTGVACPSSADCYAVGGYNDGTTIGPVIIATTDQGLVWTSETAPAGLTWLDNVACPWTSVCYGVGFDNTGNNASGSIIGTTDQGSTWTSQYNSGSPGNLFSSVACPSRSDCYAVGGNNSNGIIFATDNQGYNWSPQTIPSGAIGLGGVTCPSANDCYAVGGGTANGVILNGVANVTGQPNCSATAVGSPAAPAGYWLAGADGSVYSCGNAPFWGSLVTLGSPPAQPIVAIAGCPGVGYWLAASDGGVFAFGPTSFNGFYGSMGGQNLNDPIVGIALTPDCRGYWLVASDGGIFSFGDAQFFGSMGGQPLNAPIVGITSDPLTGGYYEVASDGGIFSFPSGPSGPPFYGSMGGQHLNKPIIGMAFDPVFGGYWLGASDGGVFAFPQVNPFTEPFYGSVPGAGVATNNVVAIVATDTYSNGGTGYWLADSLGGIYAFADAYYVGSLPGSNIDVDDVVGMANAD